jgi:hypothetical protein
VALLVGLAVQLVPLIAFPTVLSQDGPAHLDGAWVLLHHGDAGPVGGLLREHYRTDVTPVPNMFSTFALAALLTVLGADAAERVFVACFVVALVFALGYALRGVHRRAGWLAAAALPFAGSYLVAYGFYNYCWGVVGMLLVVGLAVRRRTGWTGAAAGLLALLLLVTWFAHLLPYAVAAGWVLALGLVRAHEAQRTGTPWRAALRRHLLPVVLAVVPSTLLTVVYLLSGHAPAGAPSGAPSVARVVSLLTGVGPFVVGSRAEWPAAVVTAAALLVLGAARLRSARREPGRAAVGRPERWTLGALLLAVAVAFAVTPEQFGSEFGFLDDRLAWFPPLVLVLWAATRRTGARVRAGVVTLLVLGSSAAVVARLPAEHAASAEVAALLAVSDRIPPGSTLLVLQYARTTPHGSPDPLRHESSRLALRAQSVDVGHYEAVHPYFQVSFAGGPDLRRQIDPTLRGLERFPPVVDLAAARGRLDYVVVVGLDRATERVRTAPATQRALEELSAHYARVDGGRVPALVTLWRALPGAG